MFKYIGKTKLLKILQNQLNNPNISLKDIMYSREENFSSWKEEKLCYIDENIIHILKKVYSENTKKIDFFYEKIREVEPHNFIREEFITLKEREEKQDESYIS
jgi:hypothetical protein